jgi:hypothetical protein
MLDALKPDPWPPRSHHDLIAHYYAQYDAQIASGEYQPFLYPWGTFGALPVIIYLLIPHHNRPWLKNCRFLAFAWISGFAVYTMAYTRAKGMAPSFGIGLISAWSIIWIMAILVCNDAQTDFQRIERLEGAFKNSHVPEGKQDNDITTGHAAPRNRHGSFAWQAFPMTPFIERLDWVLDIFCNFRGAGWNWRTSALPPPPREIQDQLRQNSSVLPKTSNRVHTSQVVMYPTRRALLAANTWTFVTGYLALDCLKTLLMHDPYFWGAIASPPPPVAPYSFLPKSSVATHILRLTLSMLAIQTALRTIFSLGPLVLSGVFGPKLLGARAEAWMYPESWASYTVVLDHGLAGWWGNWWHQTFRFGFGEPGRKVVEVLGLEKKGAAARAVQLGVAFGLSGCVHAAGSWTCAGKTRPITGSMAFFLCQAVGVFLEAAVTKVLRGWGVKGEKMPLWAKRAWTFVYVHVWFYFTAHLLCDDFARGGVWLFEPVPFSVLRGLGFGADHRDGWWCWAGVENVVRWHRGNSWWTTGVAF